jgi:hypothetical protein
MEDLNTKGDNMRVGNIAKGLIDQEVDNDGKIIKSELGTSLIAFEAAAKFHAQHWNQTH